MFRNLLTASLVISVFILGSVTCDIGYSASKVTCSIDTEWENKFSNELFRYKIEITGESGEIFDQVKDEARFTHGRVETVIHGRYTTEITSEFGEITEKVQKETRFLHGLDGSVETVDLKLDKKRTYKNTGNTYDIAGYILVNTTNNRKSYRIVVTGGVLGKTPEICESYLGKIGKPSVEQLMATLKEGDGYVRGEAAWALGVIKESRAIEPLIAALKDSEIKWYVVRALKNIGEPAVDPLIATLKDENPAVRKNAIEVLGDIKDPRAVDPLILALKDKNKEVREKVSEALKNITGEDFGENSEKWKKWWTEHKKTTRDDK